MVFWEQEKISRKILLVSGSLLGITVLVWHFVDWVWVAIFTSVYILN